MVYKPAHPQAITIYPVRKPVTWVTGAQDRKSHNRAKVGHDNLSDVRKFPPKYASMHAHPRNPYAAPDDEGYLCCGWVRLGMCKPSAVTAPLCVVSVTHPDPTELIGYAPRVGSFITTTQHRVPPLHGLHMVLHQNRLANQCMTTN